MQDDEVDVYGIMKLTSLHFIDIVYIKHYNYLAGINRLSELEKLYEERMRVARRSYKTQMADACKKIAGDYKRYYTKMLELETGQSGSVLQELRDTIAKQGKMLKVQEQNMSSLRTQLLEAESRVLDEHYSMDSEGSFKAETPPPPPEPDFLANTIDPDEHKKVSFFQESW